MDRILLQVKTRKDRRDLEDALASCCHVLLPGPDASLPSEFDLAIIDRDNFRALRTQILEIKNESKSLFLPVLLLISPPSHSAGRHLGKGVDDLIIRPLHESEVQARVANLLRMRHWSLDLQKEHDRAMRLAVTDDVTGFNNTRYLHRYLDRFLDAALTRPAELSLVFFDLDSFKNLVDQHGHLLGSKTLREVAQTVAKELDEEDRLVRYGGDEFIVILPRQNKREAALKVERMKRAIEHTRFLQKEGIDFHLTASFGLASFPDDAIDKKALLAAADLCLFESKTRGKNRITVTEALPQAA
jgi:diguanylate cyclase (GGDEF)-like protein